MSHSHSIWLRLLKRLQRIGKPRRSFRFDRLSALATAKSRIVFLADADRATFKLYFELPLQHLGERAFEFALLTHRSFDQAHAQDDLAIIERQIFAEYKPDYLVLTRFAMPVGVLLIEAARRRGIPVLYHLDDDLLNIPASLGSDINRQQNLDVQACRSRLMAAADMILVSTPNLRDVVAAQFPGRNVVVGPAIPYIANVASLPEKKSARRTRFTIGYMGSRGHQRDLEAVKPALINLLRTFPHLYFETFGTVALPKELSNLFSERVHSWPAHGDYYDFQRRLVSLDWNLGIAPLIDDSFNSCRTPLKFFEYTAAGIAVFASDCVVYRLPGAGLGIQLVDAQDWEAHLSSAIQGKINLNSMKGAAVDYCESNHGLAKSSAQLLEILARCRNNSPNRRQAIAKAPTVAGSAVRKSAPTQKP